ncbi:rhomboid family intramembrane serine protease [Chenggangzhangella methanolivorans]|uniref:Rhomboid family intramembrane serine protease n=1 Tax=Chenggangzhangella methanolivorans TaxID=1437009 RepID=A0A9E6RBE0_9HYPH|nr:rhomboid family intramembrane serine protease [Chenggangzhangella methanolivorans]QZO00750.1 rhomboid family intramembrane serine protease [Chenggangzhangella methanolivorans]
MPSQREPAFNAPASVLALLGACVAVHVVRSLIGENADIDVILRFAFIPARYDPASPYAADFLGGDAAKVWTFVSYAFLHGDWMHLAVNSVWMLAFGSAVAWRFGSARFLVFSAVTAAAGAATHLAFHFGTPLPVVGASGAISGQMAAATRFIFEAGGPLGAFRRNGREAFLAPAEPLSRAIRRPQVIVFLVVWFGMNLVFGLGGVPFSEEGATVAWEAHIGGFLAGLALFPLFDPVRARPTSHPNDVWGDGLHEDGGRPHDGGTGAAERSPQDR